MLLKSRFEKLDVLPILYKTSRNGKMQEKPTAIHQTRGGFSMQKNEKLPATAWLSTVFIGIYTLFFAIAGAGIAALLFYAKHITTAGTYVVSEAGTMSDYIGGYFVLPGAFAALFGSLTGVMAFLLAAVIFIPFLACLAILIISCILIKKRKLLADAWMKLIVFIILSVFSWIIFQKIWIVVIMTLPTVLCIITLSRMKKQNFVENDYYG